MRCRSANVSWLRWPAPRLAAPGLLILDEATSAVDAATERALARALQRLGEGRTMVSIAHRLATAESADLVLVFDQGRLVEVGDHRRTARCGRGLRTASRQLVGQRDRAAALTAGADGVAQTRPNPRRPFGYPGFGTRASSKRFSAAGYGSPYQPIDVDDHVGVAARCHHLDLAGVAHSGHDQVGDDLAGGVVEVRRAREVAFGPDGDEAGGGRVQPP